MSITATEIHPIAELFPRMTRDEFAELRESIQSIGLQEPIWTLNGQVIDGRERLRACVELGVRPTFRERSNGDGLAMFVVAQNLRRRHLTSSQRAALAVDLLPYLEAEAELRMLGVGKFLPRVAAAAHAITPPRRPARTRATCPTSSASRPSIQTCTRR